MFRRLLSTLLIGAMLTGTAVPALGEGLTAGEALFGNGTGAVYTSTAAPENTAQPEDMYGASDTSSINDRPTLQLGDRDTADGVAYIVTLQNRLIALGFLKDSADGVYGENTVTAVKQFQKLNGLESTGIADAATQEKIFSELTTLTTPSPANPVAYGSEIVRVQSKLIEWGFLVGSIDGEQGKKTTAAIKEFQSYLHDYCEPLPTPTPAPTPSPTPTPDPDAMPMVNDIPIVTPTPAPTPFAATGQIDQIVLAYVDGDMDFEVYRQTLDIGDESVEASRVQRRLKQLNYLYPEADGQYGLNTARALMYFQKKHGLQETGVADEATQQALFSASAQQAEEYVFPYKLYVDISDQRVYVFKWDGNAYSIPEVAMICSTGKNDTPTPTGTYQSYGRITGEWFYFDEFNVYAKWAYGIVGGILFHSVTFSEPKDSAVSDIAVINLGRKASHGCIRLSVEDAKWIYDNCPYGTTVVIQE